MMPDRTRPGGDGDPAGDGPAGPGLGRHLPVGPRDRRSAGFSLAELLVTIVVTSVIGAGVVGLLVEQNDFYGTSEDRTFADVSRRGVAEVVSSELRMLSTADLYKTKGDSIRARFDLGQGVVCDVSGNYVTLVVHFRPNISLPSGRTGTAYSSPFSADHVYADGWTSALVAEGTTGAITTCDDNGAPGTLPAQNYHSNIERIRVSAEATGDGANRYDVAQNLEIDIAFRN